MALRIAVEVARKEFLEHVLSWRFVIALGLSTLILGTSVFALGAAYEEDASAYLVSQASLEKQSESNPFLDPVREVHRVARKPNPLSIFTGGPADEFRRTTDIGFPGSGVESQSGSASPTNRRFDPLDLGFVAVVVMTFMVVMFSYDAVSGERERGTLKLLLANPVPKDSVLLGKYLGGMASVLLPFTVSVLVGLAALQSQGVTLTPEEWTRLGLALLLAVPLVSAFYLVGLLVSSLARRSATSLLSLALVWVVLVFGVGNVAAVVAKETTDATSDAEVQQRFQEIAELERIAHEELNEESLALFEKQNRQNGTLSPEDQARMDELREERTAIGERAQAERTAIVEAARRQLDNQLARAEAIAALSPAEAYRGLATALARSDYWSYQHEFEAVEAYRRAVREAQEAWDEEHGPQSFRIGPGGGSFVLVNSFGAPDGERFEPPAFAYSAPTPTEQLSSPGGVRDLLVLVGYNVLGFLGAYVAFLRYDVR